MSNLLFSQNFKTLKKKKKIIRIGEKVTVGKRELHPSMCKQTCAFSLVYWRVGMFVSFTTFLKLQLQLQGTNTYTI